MSNYHLKDTNLSLKAKGLLSMMLSLPDDWNYSTRGLAAICKEGVDSIGSGLKELEEGGYIIRNRIRGSDGRIIDTEYVIYEKPRKALPNTVSPDTEKPYMDDSDTENPAQLNTKKQNIDQLTIYESNTPSVIPSKEEKDGRNEIHALRDKMKHQIDYEQIVSIYNKKQIDEFVEIMMEVALSKGSTIKIGRDAEYPVTFVQERFNQLNSSHIEKVLEGIKENKTRVWNTKAYIMATLFNAPSSMGNHYTMLVNHDMYGIWIV